MSARVVTLVPDLFFSSKIREAARAAGVDVESTREVAALVEGARTARLVIVDLRSPKALEALDALANDPTTAAVAKVGFVDHERVEVFTEARRRGCRALAKGAFTQELPALLGSVQG